MTDKPRRPSWERQEIRRIMREKGVKYTAALREFEKARELKDATTPPSEGSG